MIERGKIHTPRLAAQLRDFSGLRYGKITATDLDAFIDFGDRLFVFIEAKLPGVEIPLGQRLAMERLVDATASSNRYAIGIIFEHQNRAGEIDFANGICTAYRWNGVWHNPKQPYTVREMVSQMLERCGLDGYLRETQP